MGSPTPYGECRLWEGILGGPHANTHKGTHSLTPKVPEDHTTEYLAVLTNVRFSYMLTTNKG